MWITRLKLRQQVEERKEEAHVQVFRARDARDGAREQRFRLRPVVWFLRLPGEIPGEVRMFRLREKSSLSTSRTAAMSVLTSSRSMMSPTRAELMFTLAVWPFALAETRYSQGFAHGHLETPPQPLPTSLTFGLLGGVEPEAGGGAAGGAGEGGGLREPGGDHEGTPDLTHQQRAQQLQPTEGHYCPEERRRHRFTGITEDFPILEIWEGGWGVI